MLSYSELKAQIAELEKKAMAAREEEISGVKVQILDLMNTFGIKAADLFNEVKKGAKKKSGSKSVVAPKYRDNEGRTWSGRGRMPSWMTDSDRETFAIKA
jgi:DNA-binding protein H-NS